jgi:hypothetical protein
MTLLSCEFVTGHSKSEGLLLDICCTCKKCATSEQMVTLHGPGSELLAFYKVISPVRSVNIYSDVQQFC